jgi:branched-chain amino acid transport system ATP-binding protein
MALLTVDKLVKRFDGLVANDSISFELQEGALFALIGPNGAGKSTLFNLISGYFPPTSGRVLFDGRDITGMPQHKVAALGLVRTYQLVQLFRDLTVAENVYVGFHLRSRGGFVSALVRPPWIKKQEVAIRRETEEILDFIGLAGRASVSASQLSYGQQRLLELARALAAGPKLLLLDEPAAGLTPQETAALAAIIQRINARGVTVLLIEHDMEMVMGLARRIVVLDSGRKIAEGSPEEVKKNEDVIMAYLGGGVADA